MGRGRHRERHFHPDRFRHPLLRVDVEMRGLLQKFCLLSDPGGVGGYGGGGRVCHRGAQGERLPMVGKFSNRSPIKSWHCFPLISISNIKTIRY